MGATFFYTDKPIGKELHIVYADTLDGLCELRLTDSDVADLRAVYYEWSPPWMVYELVNKKHA